MIYCRNCKTISLNYNTFIDGTIRVIIKRKTISSISKENEIDVEMSSSFTISKQNLSSFDRFEDMDNIYQCPNCFSTNTISIDTTRLRKQEVSFIKKCLKRRKTLNINHLNSSNQVTIKTILVKTILGDSL